jgi:DNA-binding transcriptional regulator GbsR (MarR family)
MQSEHTTEAVAQQVRANLVELGGRTAQDLGFSRIAGQILVALYLTEGDCPLDQIEADLGLSKASVSIAARQLESMGLLKRSWHQGDRRSFYRTADNLGEVFREGMVAVLRRKLDQAGGDLADSLVKLEQTSDGKGESAFLLGRVQRAKSLRDRADRVLNSRIVKYFIR